MTIEDVWRVWFGELDATGRAAPPHVARWWTKDPAFDAELRARFLETHRALAHGELTGWLTTPPGELATILVLDQLSRNMFRGSPEMFAQDPLALAAAKRMIMAGRDRALPLHPRTFVYLPLMHSEALADQDASVERFAELAKDPGGADLAQNLDFAERHRAIVRSFGRFPHRNAILGRTSTPEELTFLEGPGSSF